MQGPTEPGSLAQKAGPSEEEARRLEAARESIWNLPNQLTVARIVLSIVFFVLLALETHGQLRSLGRPFVLNVAASLFIFAVVTDFLDGYLARKWELTSTFGRIADPFADKIVVCGGFVLLSGIAPRFVEPWFGVVIMFREFLVSGLRSFLESRGLPFGAAWIGKVKMLVQSITIPVVLFDQANFAPARAAGEGGFANTAYWITVVSLAATLVITVYSCVGYVQRAVKLIRGGRTG